MIGYKEIQHLNPPELNGHDPIATRKIAEVEWAAQLEALDPPPVQARISPHKPRVPGRHMETGFIEDVYGWRSNYKISLYEEIWPDWALKGLMKLYIF